MRRVEVPERSKQQLEAELDAAKEGWKWEMVAAQQTVNAAAATSTDLDEQLELRLRHVEVLKRGKQQLKVELVLGS